MDNLYAALEHSLGKSCVPGPVVLEHIQSWYTVTIAHSNRLSCQVLWFREVLANQISSVIVLHGKALRCDINPEPMIQVLSESALLLVNLQ